MSTTAADKVVDLPRKINYEVIDEASMVAELDRLTEALDMKQKRRQRWIKSIPLESTAG